MAGPSTVTASAVPLGLAQIRVGASAANIADKSQAFSSAESLGAMASTKWMSSVDYWKLESGFPMLTDKVVPMREAVSLECAFKEVTPANMALARGLDHTGYSLAHSGEILLGALADPAYMRMEALYTYPDNDFTMVIIFPRAQVLASAELDFQAEDNPAVTITFESQRADSSIASGGDAVWDSGPLGKIEWFDNS